MNEYIYTRLFFYKENKTVELAAILRVFVVFPSPSRQMLG